MDAFAPVPPGWTEAAVHAWEFSCPKCRAAAGEATEIWLNRRSPVFTEDHRRKWQMFYLCHCGAAWWAWSNEQPPNELKKIDTSESLYDPLDDL